MQQTTFPRTEPRIAVPIPPGEASGADRSLESGPPRPEHPRPDLQRDAWVNLNGRWRFAFDPQNGGEQMRWYHVPHPAVAARTGEVSGPIEDP
ncbi:MAG: hypothetical protein ACRDI2_17135, partial [Chloroflexota bacterium]